MEEQDTIQQDIQQPQQSQSLGDKLIAMRQSWTADIEQLNEGMKNLPAIDSLLNTIFTKRQQAVDVYYGTYDILTRQNINYKKKYADIYNKLKTGSNGIRYTNENSIADQCNAQLSEEVTVIAQLRAFTDFMQETIKTLDGIQYGISSKIKIYEMMNGLK